MSSQLRISAFFCGGAPLAEPKPAAQASASHTDKSNSKPPATSVLVTVAAPRPASAAAAASGAVPLSTGARGTKRKASGSGAAASSGGVQLHLDLGQRDFACTRCATCGLLYARGAVEDEKLHRQHHAAATQGISFQVRLQHFISLSYLVFVHA